MTIPFFVFKEILINMNNCGCNNNRIITPDCDMKRWEVECSSYIENADNYYTKPEIDEMLDEIESAITSGCCITPEEVDEKISSYTYSKEEVDEKIPHYSAGTGIDITDNVISCTITGSSGCGCDLSDYVTFEDMAEYVGDVYTKEEVNNLFVTKATFNTYITNLQQQINSLIETVSGCCGSTGETEYRWIVVPNDYTCSGTTKMTKEKQQSSTDGINWTDTGQYRTGSTVLEYNSADCGYAPSSNFKVRANYKSGYTVGSGQVECNSSTTVTNDELKAQITFPTYFTSVEFGSCVDTIGNEAFINAINISSVTIPSNITTIGSCAFANVGNGSSVSSLTVTLNEGLITIDTTAFLHCGKLTDIVIPNSVKTIGDGAFEQCSGLTNVTIGTGVTYIGGSAFATTTSDNVQIASMVINAVTPPTITGSISTFYGNYPIYVPAGSVNAYKNAQYWSYLWADRIQALP